MRKAPVISSRPVRVFNCERLYVFLYIHVGSLLLEFLFYPSRSKAVNPHFSFRISPFASDFPPLLNTSQPITAVSYDYLHFLSLPQSFGPVMEKQKWKKMRKKRKMKQFQIVMSPAPAECCGNHYYNQPQLLSTTICSGNLHPLQKRHIIYLDTENVTPTKHIGGTMLNLSLANDNNGRSQ